MAGKSFPTFQVPSLKSYQLTMEHLILDTVMYAAGDTPEERDKQKKHAEESEKRAAAERVDAKLAPGKEAKRKRREEERAEEEWRVDAERRAEEERRAKERAAMQEPTEEVRSAFSDESSDGEEGDWHDRNVSDEGHHEQSSNLPPAPPGYRR